MTRVVNLISGLMYGGGQKVALDLVEGIQESRAIDAELWLLGCRHELLRERARFVAAYDGDYSSPATLIAAARQVRTKLATSNVDIVHSHGWDADMIAFLATLGRAEARVIHLHSTPDWMRSQNTRHRARRLMTMPMLNGNRTRVLAVANAVRDHWTFSFPRLAVKTHIVPNSVDLLRFNPGQPASNIEAAALIVGVACRLTAQKGLSVLLRALTNFDDTAPPIALKIAGEGPEREALVRIAHQFRISAVEFMGHIQGVENFYRSLDAFVLPSINDEGMPLTILEAMASGLPIVASDTGGIREVVRDGVDGFIVPPNDPEALAAALLELRDNPARRRDMGRSALERVRSKFSAAAQIEAVAKVYDQLMQGPSNRLRKKSLA